MSRGHAYASGDAHAAHAALSLVPRRCRGLTANETALRSICLFLGVVGGVAASGTALRSICLFLGVVGGACLCQRRRSRGACRTIACPPTLSGVNCKRDRVAVDLPVPWRCWRGGCQRRRSRGACRTIACPPTLSGVNCKRDRVAVDLPVSWRCWRGGCKRDRVAVEKPQ